ncbi:putative F-box protein At1g19160 [Rutidosis leptorrhynchoides]|uniref:putative F-box protein At1g19160 n=1 Tax=Rutidosis leptorrhynchoides TaxID=125765 RepID=UPI003A993AE1
MEIEEENSSLVTTTSNKFSDNNSQGVELATSSFLNDILEEILFEILSRLPVKTLLQFSSVSKPWLSLISNPSFAKLYFNRAVNERRTAIFITAYDPYTSKRHFLSVPHHSGPVTHLTTLDHTPISLKREFTEAEHLNGLILFNSGNGFVQNNFAFVINPSTRKVFKLPGPASVPSYTYGKVHICYFFGFNESTNEHKILNIRMLDIVSVVPFRPTTIEIMIFCMSSLTWRKIDVDLPFDVTGDDHWYVGTKRSVCVNSVIYVMLETRNQILTFDLRTEKFSIINLPIGSFVHQMDKRYWKKGMNIVTRNHPFLMKINGFLGLICRGLEMEYNEIVVWILQDYENRVWVRETVTFSDSWFLLDGPFPLNPVILRPIPLAQRSLAKDVINVPLFDMDTRSMKSVEYVLGCQSLRSSSVRFDHVRSYVESICPLKRW